MTSMWSAVRFFVEFAPEGVAPFCDPSGGPSSGVDPGFQVPRGLCRTPRLHDATVARGRRLTGAVLRLNAREIARGPKGSSENLSQRAGVVDHAAE